MIILELNMRINYNIKYNMSTHTVVTLPNIIQNIELLILGTSYK
jgi:hypothetical protein